MKIKWLQSGLSIQGLGISQEGETVNAPKSVAKNLITQGIAEQVKSAKESKETKEKKGGDR